MIMIQNYHPWMVNDALDRSSTYDSEIFLDLHIKIGIGKIKNLVISKKEIYATFHSHLALLFRRLGLTPRLGVFRCFSRRIFLDIY